MKNWVDIGLRVVSVIGTLIQGVERVRKASGPEKKAAVLEAIAAGVPALEFALDKDFLNDPKVLEAASAYVDAYVALQNAIAASKQAKAAQQPS